MVPSSDSQGIEIYVRNKRSADMVSVLPKGCQSLAKTIQGGR